MDIKALTTPNDKKMIRRDNRQFIKGAWLNLNRPNIQTPDDDHNYPIINISRGGLRFCSHDPFEINERVQVIVHMGNGEIHSAMGRICYCQDQAEKDEHGCCYGVSFLDHFLEMGLLDKD